MDGLLVQLGPVTDADRADVRAGLEPVAPENRRVRVRAAADDVRSPHRLLERPDGCRAALGGERLRMRVRPARNPDLVKVPHPPHRSVSFRLGIATNTPFVPSMIFRSLTTNALSKVTEQNASSRSLFSSHSLMRTSVMTTGVLLVGESSYRAIGL